MSYGIDKYINNLKKNIAEAIAPEINKLLRQSIYSALVGYYGDYSPQMDNRTFNLINIEGSARTYGKGNILTMTASSGLMSTYPGIYSPLQPQAAFNQMFMNGEHGHGRWLMHVTTPSPYDVVSRDIDTMFDGRAINIIDKKNL